MRNTGTARAIIGREDISRFVIHLTRDDRKTFETGGATARENFQAIIQERRIRAFLPHCLHGKHIPEPLRKKCLVCCFTKVPLTQVHLLVRKIPGRRIQLEPYGLVFSREFILAQGAQPAIYINSYDENTWLREAADHLFEAVRKDGWQKGKLWRLLPFLNAMHERYDFTWEREWRVRGDLAFRPKDVVCVILPSDEEELREKFASYGVPAIAPGWPYEEIVGELSKQQRRTRRIWVEKQTAPLQGSKKQPGAGSH
jgi:hypothetical protein